MKICIKANSDFTRATRLWIFTLLSIVGNTSAFALDVKAELDWARRVELGTPVKGVVQHIKAQPGQTVAENDILLQLDDRGFKSRVAGLTAQLAHLQAELAEADREQERALELYDRTVLSDHELQVAKNNLIASKAKYEMCRANLTQAKLDLEYSSIRAPYDAVVIARMAEVGQTIVPELQAVTLFIVADARHMLARGRLSAKDIAQISIGQEAVVEFDGKKYKGRIINFGLESLAKGESSDKPYFVNVQFPLTSSASYIGQPANINLP